MKILIENKVLSDNAVLSGLEISSNYPLSNLKNRVLTRRTQSAEGETDLVFSIAFTSPVNSNCLAFGYTNGDTIDVTVNSVPVVTGKAIDMNTDIIYFPETSVSLIEITIYGTEEVYLGSIGSGVAYKMPNPLNEFGVGITDGHELITNKYAISYQSNGEITNAPVYNFAGFKLAIKKEIMSFYPGVGSVVWVDAFENFRDLVEPLYCSIAIPWNPVLNRRGTYQLETQFQESK